MVFVFFCEFIDGIIQLVEFFHISTLLFTSCTTKSKKLIEFLNIEASPYTPFIQFSKETGVMEISGRSIPEAPDDFWNPIISWFEEYSKSPAFETVFKINLDYFNIASSKRILFLLYKLNKMSIDNKRVVKVLWCYKLNDDDMYEVGQDYKYMVKVPFEFIILD